MSSLVSIIYVRNVSLLVWNYYFYFKLIFFQKKLFNLMSYIIFYFLNISDESNQIIHEYLKKLWISQISDIQNFPDQCK